MKRITNLLLSVTVFFFSFLLTGCPTDTNYPLVTAGTVNLSAALIGTWGNEDTDADVQLVRIEKATEKNLYDVFVEKTGEDYSSDTKQYKAWLASMEGQSFLVLQENPDGEALEKYYMYHIAIGNKTFTSHEVSLKGEGTDAIKSIETYQELLAATIKEGSYLTSEIVWTKQ